MANEPKMKIGIGADTGDFDKGAKKVKQEMKDLSKVSSDAFGAIGNAIGVDTGKLTQFSSALGGIGQKFQAAGNAGTKAFGSILSSIAPVAGAVAGLGIVAATTAFKALNSEAEAFKNTVEGANMEMATAAYVQTYAQALRDMHSNTGRAVAEVQSSWKKFWGTLGATFREAWQTGAWASAPGEFNGERFGSYYTNITKANEVARSAEDITNEIYTLERKRKEQDVEIARLNAQIADALGVARDHSNSIAVRQEAIRTAEELIAQKRSLQVPLEQTITALYEQRSALATDSVEEADSLLAQQMRAFDTERALTEQANGLLRVKNSIAAAAKSAADAAEKELAARTKIAASRSEMASNPLAPVSGVGGPYKIDIPVGLLAPQPETVRAVEEQVVSILGGSVNLRLSFDADVEKIRDISTEVNSLMQGMAVKTGEAIGALVANLANGENAWSAFGDAALSAFGDLAISVGKIAIEMGLASEGIKAALTLGNPYVAIAAGVALVALGTAVKTGLANAANGNYAAASGAMTSTSSSSFAGDYDQRDVYVNVQGTLVADGDQLIAVISNTERKNHLTT